eukprot:gene17628-17831_t
MIKSVATRPKHDILREKLLTTAERIIEEKGYQALRARMLTEEVGCALGALYMVFSDMDALMMAVKLRILDQLDMTMAAVATDADALAHLLALADAYLGFAIGHRRRWETLFQHRLADATVLPEIYFRRLDEIFAHVEKPLADVLPNSSLMARASTGRALFAGVHGIVALGLEQRLGPIPEGVIRAQFYILVHSAIVGLIRQPNIASITDV